MKKIILITSAIFIATQLFSQVITVNVDEVKTFKHIGAINPLDVIEDYHFVESYETECEYILDLDKKTIALYFDNSLISKLNIQSIENNIENVYAIYLNDTSTDGTKIKTCYFIDLNKKLFYFSWYDNNADVVALQTHTKYNMHVK